MGRGLPSWKKTGAVPDAGDGHLDNLSQGQSVKTQLSGGNRAVFAAPRQLQQAICGYVEDYNCLRPHEALDHATLDEVMTQVPVLPDPWP